MNIAGERPASSLRMGSFVVFLLTARQDSP
jgi:hypothetical protein